ncbi:2-hydroxychromene-2-carboxylate isomerase [Aliiroseovarius sp. xm-m-379]|uniref:2-hydroxychromene-2-carboxylate isomerase n=1 Tax=unclassified Aliiroseovarius TaxID=2623558 RepID=UPI0015698875|nr:MULTISPECIES: 2-hydroxychromene-2-carboxylate isomerase [unclassified Aliiroseovarius]NRP14145.1 2-hydroxychromene-2-carboxylate isomerase [Aliiroseovarius sp. xm-d-517]NRP23629.1 2-hydroxychromene-2-carboxylate isomerase [Aliiroseovarius sp. xm-m-379]NRP29124.1 2-hydroxychromene-2-carboxylate isomerase [Aliiroseovarius sp. xm-m-314]NRP32428.1 2-hydroxychromene-2-carboxylate isomerase [Aliiroseovarius sp. xm-a-104]NRP40961.1 2-hydroxychromene-2-carboxylate isomerase [Aliiroseovarius sp. xm-
MAHIDYYFTVLSPWAYLAGARLEEIAARHGVGITYKPMDIMAIFERMGGQKPADRHPSRMDYRMQELKRWSAELGMEMNHTPAFWPTNPAPASYAIIAAAKAGGGDVGALVQAILRATWAEEKDIAQDEVIGDALEAHGFSRMLTITGMLDGAETYASNTEDAVKAGVFGSPFYVTDDDARFWGQDRLVQLDAHLAARS